MDYIKNLENYMSVIDSKLDRLNYLLGLATENKATCYHPLVENIDDNIHIVASTLIDEIKRFKYVRCCDCGNRLRIEV